MYYGATFVFSDSFFVSSFFLHNSEGDDLQWHRIMASWKTY